MRVRHIIMTAALSAVLLGCDSAPPPETGETKAAPAGDAREDASTAAPVLPRAAKGAGVMIGPESVTVRDMIVLKADPRLLEGSRIHWLVNGSAVVTDGGRSFRPEDVERGDMVRAVLVRKDGTEVGSNEITISNARPVVLRAFFDPPHPVCGASPGVKASGEDADGDPVTFLHQWYRNDEPVGNGPRLTVDLKRADRIRVDVTPYDGFEAGRPIVLQAEVGNAPPEVKGNEGGVSPDGLYRNRIKAIDPDGDALAFRLQEPPEGMRIDPATGEITWPPPSRTGSYPVTVIVEDGHTGRCDYRFDVTVSPSTAAPSGN